MQGEHTEQFYLPTIATAQQLRITVVETAPATSCSPPNKSLPLVQGAGKAGVYPSLLSPCCTVLPLPNPCTLLQDEDQGAKCLLPAPPLMGDGGERPAAAVNEL